MGNTGSSSGSWDHEGKTSRTRSFRQGDELVTERCYVISFPGAGDSGAPHCAEVEKWKVESRQPHPDFLIEQAAKKAAIEKAIEKAIEQAAEKAAIEQAAKKAAEEAALEKLTKILDNVQIDDSINDQEGPEALGEPSEYNLSDSS